MLYDVESDVKYEGYIKRHQKEIERTSKTRIKKSQKKLFFRNTRFIKRSHEKLSNVKPESLGQASRVSGVSSADISSLLLFVKEVSRETKNKYCF